MKRAASLCLLLCLLAGCGTPPLAWERSEDNSAARAGDMARCRSDAGRLAAERYPDRIQ